MEFSSNCLESKIEDLPSEPINNIKTHEGKCSLVGMGEYIWKSKEISQKICAALHTI